MDFLHYIEFEYLVYNFFLCTLLKSINPIFGTKILQKYFFILHHNSQLIPFLVLGKRVYPITKLYILQEDGELRIKKHR